jgi:UDPglucose 6-dehydrogenase
MNIVVIGSGVVGEAAGNDFVRRGHTVTCVDTDSSRIEQLRAAGLRVASSQRVDWRSVDVVLLVIAASTINGRASFEPLEVAAHDLGIQLRSTGRDHHPVIVVRSTELPGTTERRVKAILEMASGKVAGVDFGLAVNLEFARQASAAQGDDRTWTTVIGACDDLAARTLKSLYGPFCEACVVCTPAERSAESMCNPVYGTCGDVPYGGVCLPKDTHAFWGFAHDHGLEHPVLAAAITVNNRLWRHVAPAESPDKPEGALFVARAQRAALSGSA